MTEELKPCPFCHAALNRSTYYAQHPANGCYLSGLSVTSHERWNTRTPAQGVGAVPDDVVAKLLAAKRAAQVQDLVPEHWDKGPLGLVHELRQMLFSVADEGTGIDSGGGDGSADLWVTIQGVEYFITARRSNGQIAKDALPAPPQPGDANTKERG